MVDPFEISFADDPPKKQKSKYNPNLLWKGIKGKTKRKRSNADETSVPLEEVMTPEQLALEEEQKQKELDSLPDIDVPEIETHVEDLPEEDVNEKKLVVEHTDENEPTQEPVENIPSAEEELPDVLDKTQAEKILGEEIPEKPKEEGGDVTLTPDEKQNADMNELRALAQDDLQGFKYDTNMDKWTPKQKQDAIKAWRDKQPPKEEPPKEEPPKEEPVVEEPEEEIPPMTDEEALAEARMLAQDDLEGFEINGKDWSKLSTKEKLQVIENFKNKNIEPGDEIHNENTENNYESYEHYPTGLRVAEDVLGGVNNIANRVSSASRKNLAGGDSINNAVARASVPHYDYRSFFK